MTDRKPRWTAEQRRARDAALAAAEAVPGPTPLRWRALLRMAKWLA